MAHGTFSGREIVKVMVNSGIYEWDRTNGDHAILRWEPPTDHDSDARTVPVPLHDEVDMGTLQSIAEQAGAKDFDEFCAWIERNSQLIPILHSRVNPLVRSYRKTRGAELSITSAA